MWDKLTVTHALVSIVILNYNGKDIVEKCVTSVLNTNYPNFEIIFVDNASTDGSYESVIEKFGNDNRLRVFRNDENMGFAEGNNIGLKKSKGSYITLLNNDTEVEKDWLLEVIRIAESNEEIGIIQSKLFFLSNRHILESAGAFIDKCGYGFERGFVKGSKVYCDVAEVFYANGAAVTIKKLALENMWRGTSRELFDPDYFFSYEDVDLCWRMKLAGYKTVIAPNSIVYHRRSTTTSRQLGKHIFHHCKNRIMTLIKNYSLTNLLHYLPLLIILELIRAWSHLSKGRSEGAVAILKAITWNLIRFKQTWIKRLAIQTLIRRVPDRSVTRLMRNVNLASLIYNQRLYEEFSVSTGVNIIR
ncbi:glycosyltransferase family 2 protein [Candidatus Bathyarchaeota archaeon A05DMB-2]|jgi:GT2 family glycosyltransferase|nr:glycosyltransferase family 2 protein [Candidatus Bathyarchaeota archaeon A05DMB-2]